MKIKYQPGQRCIKVTDVPEDIEGLSFKNKVQELTISIGYTGDSSSSKGVVLDHLIVPIIAKALRQACENYENTVKDLKRHKA